jgi:hypothetical protein
MKKKYQEPKMNIFEMAFGNDIVTASDGMQSVSDDADNIDEIFNSPSTSGISETPEP